MSIISNYYLLITYHSNKLCLRECLPIHLLDFESQDPYLFDNFYKVLYQIRIFLYW